MLWLIYHDIPSAQTAGVLSHTSIDDLSEAGELALKILCLDFEEQVADIENSAGLGVLVCSDGCVASALTKKRLCCVGDIGSDILDLLLDLLDHRRLGV